MEPIEDELESRDLVVDMVYEGGRSGNAGDDPLHRLIGVSNQGGFRYLGTLESPRLIVITSSFTDVDWPDMLDQRSGMLTYYGDNKHHGRELHDTPRFGNILLREMFAAAHAQPNRRGAVPPVLVFANAGSYRDTRFVGLAVPGCSELPPMEDLVAIWKTSNGQRFQNYRASFTVLDCPKVPRVWLEDVRTGRAASANAPKAWLRWVQTGEYEPLRAEPTAEHRSRQEQMPRDSVGHQILRTLQTYFADNPTGFEACATKIVQLMDGNFVSFDLTRPSRDGGRDAIGRYRLGRGSTSITVDCALEAKCYSIENSVGVRETARLISRLRYRQFGVIVTTSYVHSQAYRELKEDGHPVVVVAARDILEILAHAGITTGSALEEWLQGHFPRSS